MERLLTQPQVLSQLCRHHQTQQPLPPEQATALAAYHGCRYNSALAILNKVAAGVAEQMYGHFGGDGEDYWRGSWEAVSGLPGAVASYGCLKEVRGVMQPIGWCVMSMAHHAQLQCNCLGAAYSTISTSQLLHVGMYLLNDSCCSLSVVVVDACYGCPSGDISLLSDILAHSSEAV